MAYRLKETKVITEAQVLEAIRQGHKEIIVDPACVVTPLAKDLIAQQRITLVKGGAGESGSGSACSSGSSYCIRCGACKEPSFTGAEPAESVSEMIKRLDAFLAYCWADGEPEDIRLLRRHTLPPMGNMPCVFYANFDLFWAGENIQVFRLLAQKRSVPLKELCTAFGAVLERHAARLSKWKMEQTVSLLKVLSDFFKQGRPKSYEDFLAVTEKAMVALDKIQSYIDAILPWSHLDKALSLRPPLCEIVSLAGGERYVSDASSCQDCSVQNCPGGDCSAQEGEKSVPLEKIVEQIVKEVCSQLRSC